MSFKHSLNLYENAIDSLNVGMRIYKDSVDNKSMYKFCIIIISNFVELLLKHMVELQNPQLCFVKPYSVTINREKTIGWEQAIQILNNSNITIGEELVFFIKKLSELRNDIIHYKFEYETSIIRSLIVFTINGLRKIYANVAKHDFINEVSDDTRKLLKTIETEYLKELHLAQENAKEQANEYGICCVNCNFCGTSETAVKLEEDGRIYCYFCEESDFEMECYKCTELYRISDMEYIGESENGDDLFICQHCSDLLEA